MAKTITAENFEQEVLVRETGITGFLGNMVWTVHASGTDR